MANKKIVKPAEETQEVKPEVKKVQEPAVTIPKSLWLRIKRAGLDFKFYTTDGISRLFLGDNLDDIFAELAEVEGQAATATSTSKMPEQKNAVKKG